MIDGLKPYPDYRDSGVEAVGLVPQHWEIVRLGMIGRFLKGSGGNKDDEVPVGVPCVRYGDLYTQYDFFIRRTRSFIAPELAETYTPVFRGDVLFAGSGETFEDIGKSAVVLLDRPAVAGGDMLILRPARPMVPEFLGYLAGSPQSVSQKSQMGRGVTVKHIYSSELKYLWFAAPAVEEQSAIVRFIDHADRLIRRFISAKQKLIKLLEEQRLVTIHRAVSRGLDNAVSLKPSGFTWLGDIPSHWDVVRIKSVARMESGHTPSRGNQLHWLDDNDIPWVSLNDTKHLDRVDYISDTAVHINDLGLAQSSARMLPAGVVVFTRDAAVGKAAITTRPMAVSQHLIGWVCGPRISNEYLLRVLYAMKPELQKLSFGSTIPTIGMPDVRKLVTPVPPIDEQVAIASFVVEACKHLDHAISCARVELDALRELRVRVIADVVTGRLDVRGAAAELPDKDEDPGPLDDADVADSDESEHQAELDAVVEEMVA